MIPLMWPNVFDGQEGDTLYVEYEIEVPPEETEVNYPNSPGSAGDLSDFSGNSILYDKGYTITFNIILTITNATGKIFPSSDKNGVQISGPTSYVITYILPPVHVNLKR